MPLKNVIVSEWTDSGFQIGFLMYSVYLRGGYLSKRPEDFNVNEILAFKVLYYKTLTAAMEQRALKM
jgi:hypothetical protein